jgi:subtilisin family serine protease/subtilisin-like proprotein convertase family protein
MKSVIHLMIFIMLSGCIEQPEVVSEPERRPNMSFNCETVTDVTIAGDINAYQWVPFTENASVVLGALPAGTYTYSFTQNKPVWLSINSSTGDFSGTPTELETHQNIGVQAVRSGDGAVFSQIFSLGVNGDPVRYNQWALHNTGTQKSFALRNPTSGVDINAREVFAMGITGDGVKVAVSDTGVEISHDDLCSNVLDGASKDYTLKPPYNGYPVPTGSSGPGHGTNVAGLIASKGWNNLGTTGVAPNSKIAGFQFLTSNATTAILIDQASGDFDIFNYSYGDFAPFDRTSDEDYLDYLRYQVLNGRNGLGRLYFKAAGNEYVVADNYSSPNVCVSHNANAPLENESPYILLVGAINASGEKASYSSAGSNIWISAPGGEFGVLDPALITTDLSGCFQGLSKASAANENDFEYGHPLNERCDFTSIMNGTSGATPIASGVAALILEANPNLSWRDVKHIMAVTATQIDAGNTSPYATLHPSQTADNISSAFQSCLNYSLPDHVYEQGWVTNAAGFHFHNFYGFGMVDAKAAVDLALDTSSDPMLPLPPMIELNRNFDLMNYIKSPNIAIPDRSASGVTDVLAVSQSTISTVESVQIKVSASHTWSIGELGIELTSPSGTKSILLNVNNSFMLDRDQSMDMVLTSHAFYGESPNGNWTIKLLDGVNEDTGVLRNWSLNIIGH